MTTRLRSARWVIVALVAIYAVMHVAAIWTESINWDEFALLWRAEKAASTGILIGGGRPGLGVALLAPFVDGCDSTIDVVHHTRLLWSVFTFAIFAGTFWFVRMAARRSPLASFDAVLGLAAFMLLPVMMRWSLQVRTDQPAVAFAIWGGVALLASRRRPAIAVVAGFAIGVGYLFSQKAVYVTGLVAIVAAGDLFIDRELQLRRLAIRGACLLVGGALAITGYRILIAVAFSTPPGSDSLERGLDLFRWYRHIVGYRVYRGMLPTLWPHITLLGLVVFGLARASRNGGAPLRVSAVAVCALVAGVAVALFHAAAFPYFTITLGVFAATAIGLGWSSVRELAPRGARYLGAAAVALLVARAVSYRIELTHDTQAVQRTTLELADSLPRNLRGFHPDGALVCRSDPSPFPVYLREVVETQFSAKNRDANSAALLAEFRARPVAFVVRTHRFLQFPPLIQTFWSTHYLPYAGTVDLAGQRVIGEASSTHALDILVAGDYRWLPRTSERLVIGSRTLAANDTIALDAGIRSATLVDAGRGELVLAIDASRAPAREAFFADPPLAEISGTRSDWW